MNPGDLCHTRTTTAFYVTYQEENHDRHGELYPSDILMYLGESYEDFSRVFAPTNGKSGWIFRSYLEAL